MNSSQCPIGNKEENKREKDRDGKLHFVVLKQFQVNDRRLLEKQIVSVEEGKLRRRKRGGSRAAVVEMKLSSMIHGLLE